MLHRGKSLNPKASTQASFCVRVRACWVTVQAFRGTVLAFWVTVPGLLGDCTSVFGVTVQALWGDCTGLLGDCTLLGVTVQRRLGDCAELRGDCTGSIGRLFATFIPNLEGKQSNC